MLAANYGLQNTSNNIANMQSSGFKRSDVFYSSLGNGGADAHLGGGVCVGGNATNFGDGKYLETNNPADCAVVGPGFFVVRMTTGELLYTRDGEFGFNHEGILIDKHSGGEVQGYNSAHNLVPIHEKGSKTCAGKATHELFVHGQWIRIEKSEEEQKEPGPFKNKFKNISFAINNVYDAQGKAHKLTFEFQSTPVLVNQDSTNIPDDGKSWDLINITCDDMAIQWNPSQKILFSGMDSAPTLDDCNIHFSLNNEAQTTLHLGTYNDSMDNCVQIKDAKLNPEGTNIEVYQNDGYAEGKPMNFSFDDNGQISYHYDNGQTVEGIYIALARFDDMEHTLIQTQDNVFHAKSNQGIHWGRANQDGFGSIKSNQLESSNVDATTEFANIVILQRMFQACSQIMDIDKQLLQELQSK
jgi:flagellar hook protein FlgE